MVLVKKEVGLVRETWNFAVAERGDYTVIYLVEYSRMERPSTRHRVFKSVASWTNLRGGAWDPPLPDGVKEEALRQFTSRIVVRRHLYTSG